MPRWGTVGRRAPGNGLEALPAGLPVLDGVLFDVRGIVQLTGRLTRCSRPAVSEQVRGIPIGLKCRRLHFLHATLGVEDGTRLPATSFTMPTVNVKSCPWCTGRPA